MYKRIQLCAAVLGICLPAYSQVVLNTGDTFTYEFNTLPFVEVASGPLMIPAGFFSFTLSGIGDPDLNQLRYEAFENSTAETPLCSGIWGIDPGRCEFPASWRDFQGVVRFSMIRGSATLETMTFHVETVRDMVSHNVYESVVVPVPEPSTVTLLACGLFAGSIGMLRKKSNREIA